MSFGYYRCDIDITHPRKILATPVSCMYIGYAYVGWLLSEFQCSVHSRPIYHGECLLLSISAIVTAIGCSVETESREPCLTVKRSVYIHTRLNVTTSLLCTLSKQNAAIGHEPFLAGTDIDWCRGQHWKITLRSCAMLPEVTLHNISYRTGWHRPIVTPLPVIKV